MKSLRTVTTVVQWGQGTHVSSSGHQAPGDICHVKASCSSVRSEVFLFVYLFHFAIVVILNENPGVWNLGSLLLSDF